MASETMESAIMMEIASIRDFVQKELHRGPRSTRQFILERLNSIERTLNEGDPK